MSNTLTAQQIREIHNTVPFGATVGGQLAQPNKIQTIKMVRIVTGLGLKEAKELVEDAIEPKVIRVTVFYKPGVGSPFSFSTLEAALSLLHNAVAEGHTVHIGHEFAGLWEKE